MKMRSHGAAILIIAPPNQANKGTLLTHSTGLTILVKQTPRLYGKLRAKVVAMHEISSRRESKHL